MLSTGKLKILELFSGSATFSQIAEERGHEARTLDINPEYHPTYCADILNWDVNELGGWKPDVIWASPECRYYSLMNGRRLNEYFDSNFQPINPGSIRAVEQVKKTLGLIYLLQPKRYFIENPKAMLRLMPFMPRCRKTISYCKYGLKAQKYTDIWTDSTWSWIAKTPCRRGDKCHVGRTHPESMRMGGGSYERAKLPKALCVEIITHLETELSGEGL